MPNLGLDFSKIRSMYDIKDRDTLFLKVQFVLEHLDRERYKVFRSGLYSLRQNISRIEVESKKGVDYTVLDDIRHHLDPDSLRNPSKAVKMAYLEQIAEDRLMKNAKIRGIDPERLKKTARDLNVIERCAKSIYSRPKSAAGFNADREQSQKMKLIVSVQN